jgi:hypothetical protein
MYHIITGRIIMQNITLTGLNYPAIAVAAVADFILGFLWYSRPLFGKAWQKLVGFSDEEIKAGAKPAPFVVSFLLSLFIAFSLSVLLNAGSRTFGEGLLIGIFAGIGIAMATSLPEYLYTRRGVKLFLIDYCYRGLGVIIMSAILSAWR